MGFDYSAYKLKHGTLVKVELDQLPGKPVVHLEWLGDTNPTWMGDQIAQANVKKAAADRGNAKVTEKSRREAREKNRDILAKHAVRKLDAIHTDSGKTASDADIPIFVAALPDDIIDFLAGFVINPENFRERAIEGDPKELAEK